MPSGLVLPDVTDPIEAALQALAGFLVERVPALTGLVEVGGADYETDRPPPWLAIVQAGPLRLDTFQGVDDVADETSAAAIAGAPGTIVLGMGEFVGAIKLTLGVRNRAERAALSTAILQAILGQSDDVDGDHHGIGVFVMGAPKMLGFDGATAARATASFELARGGWEDERAFTADRRATLELDASIGVLGVRTVPGTQDVIIVSRTPDMDTPAATVPTSNQVVTADGDLIPA